MCIVKRKREEQMVNKPHQCSFLECLIPSNKREFGIRTCLSLSGIVISTIVVLFNHSCGHTNIWTELLLVMNIFQLLIVLYGYYKRKVYTTKCQFYTKECNNRSHLFTFILLCLTIQTLFFLTTVKCPQHAVSVKYGLIAITIFRCIQLLSDFTN